ncbi:phosphotransferase [Cohnella sp. CFH 77786]|uniref:phosphotransferase family protein n=1 Tax=Cohnella sp. CFH 77786 TaxID=2662265 RepID=UPI001C6083BE|nr:aminoglycoside phosphotransferase family protein [Cohnella sp. CFH 77786]MBW5446366.1 phosphotransferase [Cohnella sp. CFH 77786]
MEGIYKTKIEASVLSGIIREAFDCAMESSAEMTGGWANSAYAVRLEDGRRVVLKAGPPKSAKMMRYEYRIMHTEVEAMRLLAPLENLPIPRIYHHDDSCRVLPVEFFIMDYIEGDIYNTVKDSLPEEQRASIEFEIGRMNRLINDVQGSRFGLFSKATESTWRNAFRDLIFGVLEDGEEAGMNMPVPYADLRKKIESRLGVMDEVKEPRLVHWDLWDGNIFVRNGSVSGLIDFERALWGDPLMEFFFGRFRPSPSFRKGYGRSELTENEQARRTLYDLYLDLILYVECAYRQYEDRNHVIWTQDNLTASLTSFMND